MAMKLDSGVFYAPYIPSIFKENMTWKKQLLKIEFDILTIRRKVEDIDLENYATERMQKYYPGPYRVVEKYIPSRMVIGLALEFDDPNEELIWLLQYT